MNNECGMIFVIDNNKSRLNKTISSINRVRRSYWKATGREKISNCCPDNRKIEYCIEPNGNTCDFSVWEGAQIVFMHAGNPCRRSYIEANSNTIFLLISGDENGVNGDDYGFNCVGYPSFWNPDSYSCNSWSFFLKQLGNPSEWQKKELVIRKNCLEKASQVFGIDITISKIIHEINLRTLSFKIDKKKKMPRQKNLWVTSGSGSLPSV